MFFFTIVYTSCILNATLKKGIDNGNNIDNDNETFTVVNTLHFQCFTNKNGLCSWQ